MRMKAAGIAIAMGVLLAMAGGAMADGIDWSHDLAGAETQAKQTNRLVVLDVYTDWCGWCKKLDADVYTKDEVIQAMQEFYPVKLNAEKDGQDAAQKYRVDGYPCILFIDGDGHQVGRISGYKEADAFVSDMKSIYADFHDFPLLEAKVQKNPDDMNSALKLIDGYILRNRIDDAAQLADKIAGNMGTHAGALNNKIGGGYAGVGNSDKAIAWYTKTLQQSRVTQDLFAAHAGLYGVYQAQNNKAGMHNELQAILALPGIPADLKAHVQDMLNKLG